MLDTSADPQIDPVKVQELAPTILVQLARLTKAVMNRVKEGDNFDPSIHMEMGSSVALLVKCVKGEEDGTGQRPAAGKASGQGNGRGGSNADRASGVRPDRNDRVRKAAPPGRPAGVRPRVRKGGQRADTGPTHQSEAEHEIERQYGIKL